MICCPPIPIPGVSQGSLQGGTNIEKQLFNVLLIILRHVAFVGRDDASSHRKLPDDATAATRAKARSCNHAETNSDRSCCVKFDKTIIQLPPGYRRWRGDIAMYGWIDG